jgi:hypothetical protein
MNADISLQEAGDAVIVSVEIVDKHGDVPSCDNFSFVF